MAQDKENSKTGNKKAQPPKKKVTAKVKPQAKAKANTTKPKTKTSTKAKSTKTITEVKAKTRKIKKTTAKTARAKEKQQQDRGEVVSPNVRYRSDSNKPHRKAFKRSIKLRERYLNHLIAIGRIRMSSVKYHGVILTFFGCGKWKYGPGTFTSFVATLLWLGASYYFFLKDIPIWVETAMWFSAAMFMFIYGVFIVPIYSKVLGVEDHKSIVLDEVMGQVLALSITYPFIKPYYFVIDDARINALVIISHVSFCFLLFRLLDIAKPSIIGTIDRNIKGGVGVMLDDLLCGVISGIFGIAIFKALEHSLHIPT